MGDGSTSIVIICQHNAKFSHGIFYEWDIIAKNLAQANVDPRGLSLRKLYNAKSKNFCNREAKQDSDPVPLPEKPSPVPSYDERKLQQLFNFLQNLSILDDVSFDKEQGELIADRVKTEIARLCSQ